MKNAIIWGLIIGVLSGIWMFVMHSSGVAPSNEKVATLEYFSFIIPAIGLFAGIYSYRKNECNDQMGFLEALIQSFKILIAGGIVTVFAGILYFSYVSQANTLSEFSGRIFGALLVGVLLAFAVSLLFANKSNKVD
jgi:amino acid transporter